MFETGRSYLSRWKTPYAIAVGATCVAALSGQLLEQDFSGHPDAAKPAPLDCNYQTVDPQVPNADKNWDTVDRLLHVRPGQHDTVQWFPAACDTTMTRAELADGVTQSPSVLNDKDLAAEFGNCVLVGVQDQLTATVGDKDKFAVLACEVEPTLVQI